MSLAWNPFDPNPEATAIAVTAYWEARQRTGVFTNNTKDQIEGKVKPPRLQNKKYINPTIGFNLVEYAPGEIRRYPISTIVDATLRRKQIQRVRAAIAAMHHLTDFRFKTFAHEAEIQVTRVL